MTDRKKTIVVTATTVAMITVCVFLIVQIVFAKNPSSYEDYPSISSQTTIDDYNAKYIALLPEDALHPTTSFAIGAYEGPSGWEHYYNLPMTAVLERMRSLGFDETDYPYWTRKDGCKMLGDYIMCAGSLDEYSYGDIIETSLGQGIICDTGSIFANDNYDIDIATIWL